MSTPASPEPETPGRVLARMAESVQKVMTAQDTSERPVRRPPRGPKTTQHTIRVPDELWIAVQDKAYPAGENCTDIMLRALREYVS